MSRIQICAMALLLTGVVQAAEPLCCGNAAGPEKTPTTPFRLENATRRAMGRGELKAKSQAEILKAENELKKFNQEAAKFVMKNVKDDKAALQLFQKMVQERAFAELAPPIKRIVETKNFLHSWGPPLNGLTQDTFIEEKTFVGSCQSLMESIAQGQVPFVIGGAADTNNQFLHCVAIGDNNRFFCSGTLIHPRLVVTAHHCDPNSIKRIFIGQQVSPTLSPDGHSYEVESVRVVPDDGASDGPPHDVMVLVLKDPVDAAHATPSPLATIDEAQNAKWCWIVGFGTSFFDPSSGAGGFGVRRKSPVPLIPGSLASQNVAEAFGCHFEFEFATGNLFGQASCFGDSGGPVYVITQNNELKVAGAVSRALAQDVIGSEICGLGAVNTLIPKYPDLLEAPESSDSSEPTEPTDENQVVHNLQISRHTTTSLTNSDADTILADASSALQTNDGPGDVACNVRLQRNGNVTTFTVGDGTIDSSFELNQVLQAPGWIKIVKEINWCGGPGNSIIGCAPVPGTSLAVVRFTSNQEGVLWLHEFGHNKGLSHRDEAHAVMRPYIGTTHRRVNQDECNHYRATSAPATSESYLAAAAAENEDVPVEEFVKRRYVHGLPWEQAAKYSSKQDVKKLVELLDQEQTAAWHDNIVATLALSGNKKAVKPLLAFIESGKDELSDDAWRAKRTGVMLMGVLVNKTQNKKALKFLQQTAQQDNQAASEYEWTVPGNNETAYRRERLATMAIWGLSLSGQDSAIETLEQLKNQLPTNFQDESGQAVVNEALAAAKKVKDVGVMNFHVQKHSP
ncbi:MAG: S1 family peptidase [Planctomycetaceae bacterium]|nr:S1 family peptidase [Planctomycetaceae bacterium]